MRNTESKASRRSFVKVSAGAMAVLGGAGGASRESLALDGGPKTVTFPAARHAEVTRWPRLGAAEKEALHRLIDSNRFYQELPLLEKDWQDYTKSPFVKAHCNCSSALLSMYFAIDLPPGSEVLVPSYTFFSTVASMRFFGYVPVFVDLDPHTACFDLEDARKKITKQTRAMVVMHSFGMPCEMDHISAFAKERGLILLEDAAQAHGASMQGKMMGAWGAMGTYSFQASKVLPGVEGGIGMYQTRELYERAAVLGHYEDPPKFPKDSPYRKYVETGLGLKLRMHPFAAAVIRSQLPKLEERSALVRSRVRKLNERLLQLPGLSEPRCRPDQVRAYYSGNMLFIDEKKAGFSRDALVKGLQAEGVRARVWIYPLQHKYAIYSEAKWWHHPPVIPERLPGCEEVNGKHVFVPLLYAEEPELLDQYARAFEKLWTQREALAKL